MTTARDIMRAGAKFVREGETLLSAARQMRELGVDALPVCADNGQLVGIITDRDIVIKCLANGSDPARTTVGELAQRRTVTVDADADISEVLDTMEEHHIRRLPVTDNHRLAGMITEADLARNLSGEQVGQFVQAFCA